MLKQKRKSFLKKELIHHFQNNPKKEYNYKQIAFSLNISSTDDKKRITKELNKLANEGIIDSLSKGKYKFKKSNKEHYKGTFLLQSIKQGFVFYKELDKNIVINRASFNKAFHEDLVEVRITRKRKDIFEGEIVRVLEHKKKLFVGILKIENDIAFVLIRKRDISIDFFIDKKQLTGYSNGDKVLVEYKDWTERGECPSGVLIKSFGRKGQINTELQALLSDYNLPLCFPDEVEAAARNIDQTISLKEIKKRKDFRDTLTFTIDPKTAKDFDDAISFKIIDENLFEIGIHIADASHYVQPNSVLDKEAYKRGTSIYLVDGVIPMLPETLSNNVCSLNPHEDKYTFSAVFEIDLKGEIKNEWFGKTVIHSDHRFAYEEAQELIETKKAIVSKATSLINKSYSVSNKVLSAILELNRIAKILRAKRMEQGALSFDREEVSFNLKDDNTPESIYFKRSEDANKLIEEFMLLANKRVATFIGKRKNPLPFIYRIHDKPDNDKLRNLQTLVSNFGYKLNLKETNINKSLNKLLLSIKGTEEQNLINTLVIRCMSKAEYKVDNIGHYGLSFDFYSHFTSPIRRYPDIMVHRLLEHYLAKQKTDDNLAEICIHTSQREQLATKVERDSIKLMQIKFMENKIGEVFDGVISGVTERGIYVELIENKCEGMILVKNILGDYFVFDEKNYALIGKRTKRKYQLGSPIKISVSKADLNKRHLDFKLEE